jgi:hypothetical protein
MNFFMLFLLGAQGGKPSSCRLPVSSMWILKRIHQPSRGCTGNKAKNVPAAILAAFRAETGEIPKNAIESLSIMIARPAPVSKRIVSSPILFKT